MITPLTADAELRTKHVEVAGFIGSRIDAYLGCWRSASSIGASDTCAEVAGTFSDIGISFAETLKSAAEVGSPSLNSCSRQPGYVGG